MDAEPAVPEASRKRRFPWIPLISILVLAAIVAAVLIPSTADYVDRSQAAEAVNLLGGTKTALTEYFVDRKRWPSSLGEVAGTLDGKYVQSISITKGAGATTGEIELTALMKKEGADPRVAGKTVRLYTTDGGSSWLCRAGTMPEKSLPASCRAQ